MKLQDLTLKQISALCANQNNCSDCPLWSQEYDRCYLDHSFAPYTINQWMFDIEIDDNLLEKK